jgi:hypothetical protein
VRKGNRKIEVIILDGGNEVTTVDLNEPLELV